VLSSLFALSTVQSEFKWDFVVDTISDFSLPACLLNQKPYRFTATVRSICSSSTAPKIDLYSMTPLVLLGNQGIEMGTEHMVKLTSG
jgi:hypothetical protein